MLTLSRQQLAQFEDLAERQFQNRLLSHLLAKHADVVPHGAAIESPKSRLADLPPGTLAAFVSASLRRARGRGLSWASNLSAYVVLRILVAPDFDDAPRLAQRLSAAAAADVRFDDIVANFDDQDWDAVRRERAASRRTAHHG